MSEWVAVEGPEGEKVWKESGEIELARDPDTFEHLQGNSECKGLFLIGVVQHAVLSNQ